MSRNRRLALALGAGAVAVIGYLLVRRDDAKDTRAAPPPVAAGSPVTAAPDARRVRTPGPRLAMPSPAVADATVPARCATGTSVADSWWDCLPRSPGWDATRASYLRERLTRHVGVNLDPTAIECRTRCCRLRIPSDVHAAHAEELSSVVGIRIGPTAGFMSRPVPGDTTKIEITTCWKPGTIEDYPDRGLEREELLAATRAQVHACAEGLPAPITFTLTVILDDEAAVDVISTSLGANETVAACVSAALREAAAFEPAPDTMSRSIPITITLAP